MVQILFHFLPAALELLPVFICDVSGLFSMLQEYYTHCRIILWEISVSIPLGILGFSSLEHLLCVGPKAGGTMSVPYF